MVRIYRDARRLCRLVAEQAVGDDASDRRILQEIGADVRVLGRLDALTGERSRKARSISVRIGVGDGRLARRRGVLGVPGGEVAVGLDQPSDACECKACLCRAVELLQGLAQVCGSVSMDAVVSERESGA
jgi:hypothetical protein